MTQRGERRRLPTTHYLLPYERHAAAAMLHKQRDHPESKVVKQLQERLGPEGIVLNTASNRDGILAALACLMAGGVLIASRANGPGPIRVLPASISRALLPATFIGTRPAAEASSSRVPGEGWPHLEQSGVEREQVGQFADGPPDIQLGYEADYNSGSETDAGRSLAESSIRFGSVMVGALSAAEHQ